MRVGAFLKAVARKCLPVDGGVDSSDTRTATTSEIDEPRYTHADSVECNHRGSEKAHIEDVGGGCDDGRNDKDDQY
jgi:hypothetical protein